MNIVLKPVVRSVLFDLDGTLIDTAPDLVYSLNVILSDLKLPSVTVDAIRPYISGGFESMLNAGVDRRIGIDEIEGLRQAFSQVYSNNLSERTRLFEGMPQLLNVIEQRGLCWGVVTNKPAFLTDPLMQQMKLTGKCCAIISADTTAEKKPHPLPMIEASERCGVSTKQCIYIGDDERDIAAGNAAGMSTLAASWGYHYPPDSINKWPAMGIVSHPLQILDWL